MDEMQQTCTPVAALSALPERQLINLAGCWRYVYFHIRATAVTPPEGRVRNPVGLALVVDRSGSMSGDKIETAKQAVVAVLDRLDERDRVAVVIYDDVINVLHPAAPASPEVKAAIREALAEVEARAFTALHQGWLTGCQAIASDSADTRRVTRCFLLTDGLANVGVTDPERIAADAARVREKALITTSTFGIGTDYDEGLLGPMAVAGGGQFHHLRTTRDMTRAFTGELGEMTEVTARGVELELELAPGVDIDLLSDYWSASEGASRFRIAIGDLISGEERHIVARLRFPPHRGPGEWLMRARLLWRTDGAPGSTDWVDLRFTYAADAACNAEEPDRTVMHWACLHDAERAKREAVARSRRGDLDGARISLCAASARLDRFAAMDADVSMAMSSIQRMQERVARAPASSAFAKDVSYISYRRTRGQRDHRRAKDEQGDES